MSRKSGLWNPRDSLSDRSLRGPVIIETVIFHAYTFVIKSRSHNH